MNNQTWYKVQLTADSAGARRQLEIQKEFEQLYLTVPGTRDVAMYSTGLIGDANGFCVYFSPATGALDGFTTFLERVDVKPCARPTDVKAFLVGNTDTMRELVGYAPGGH
jgi:hypothetical protein